MSFQNPGRSTDQIKDVTNSLIQLINRMAYEKKEEIIEGILRLLKFGK